MKKLVFAIVSIALVGSANAQEAADRKFQAGLVFGTGLNFQKMGTKLMENDGAGSDLLIGGNMNIMFNETIGLTTGVEFDFNTTKYKPGSSNVYYTYNDNTIEEVADGQLNEFGNVNYTDKQLFQLENRKQKATYLTIPTMLIFRTNFIGYFRYFGKFGLRTSFLLSQKNNDSGINLDEMATDPYTSSNVIVDNTNMKSKNEMFFFKSAVGIAGGAEWNFTGTTCLVAEIGYYYGFTPLYYNRNSPYLFTAGQSNGSASVTDPSGTDVPFSNKATQSQLQLKISILF